MSLIDRFMFRVVMVPECDCWFWDLHLDKDGYGTIAVDGKTRHAHIVSYELFVGSVPDGLQLDHKCRNRGCVNWRHLEPVTNLENQLRSPVTMISKEECNYGHGPFVFAPERRHRKWICRECERAQSQRRHARDKIRLGRGDAPQMRTHCNHGHEFTPANTQMKVKVETGKRYRSCRACQLMRRKRKAARYGQG